MRDRFTANTCLSISILITCIQHVADTNNPVRRSSSKKKIKESVHQPTRRKDPPIDDSANTKWIDCLSVIVGTVTIIMKSGFSFRLIDREPR